MTTKTIEQRLSELEAQVAKLEIGGLSRRVMGVASKKKLSVKEFLMAKQLKSEVQKALALGYYLEHVEGMPLFNINDLITMFHAAKEKCPQNMNDIVNKNVARGLLMEVREKKESKKAWVLTSTGEKYIEEELRM